MSAKPVKIVVVTDDNSLFQAMYVHGQRTNTDETIFASDIESAAAGRPILLRTESIELPAMADFPTTLRKCLKFKIAENCQ